MSSFAREGQNTVQEYLENGVFMAIALICYLSMAYLLLFKTHLIINKFKLNQGFDQEVISIQISNLLVLEIALIIIGGVLIVEEIPNFIRDIFAYIQERKDLMPESPRYYPIVLSGVKIILGLLIIGERKRITGLVGKEAPIPANTENDG